MEAHKSHPEVGVPECGGVVTGARAGLGRAGAARP